VCRSPGAAKDRDDQHHLDYRQVEVVGLIAARDLIRPERPWSGKRTLIGEVKPWLI
jgi:hypothetical protein